jgi:hypothetical protein
VEEVGELMERIACVGSREAPRVVLKWMEETGAKLVRAGYTVVSGNAPGSDQAWARGGNSMDPERVELCLPWESFESSAVHGRNVVRVFGVDLVSKQRYILRVQETHPSFARLSDGALRLHARNAMIVENAHLVLGALNPAKPGGGGTGSAFRIAQRQGICTFNVADSLVRRMIDERLAEGLDPRGKVYNTAGAKRW